MKKYILVWLFLILQPAVLPACDICGCGAGNYYFGIMPQFHKNFVGFRYRYSSFQSHVGMASMFATREQFQTTELWGRYYLHPKVQLLAFMPYSFNTQTDTQATRHLQGLNDAVINANYSLFKTKEDTIIHTWKHNLLVGGGIKLPTGKYNYEPTDATQVANPNFQLGTGSIDFLLNLTYTIRYKRLGISTDLSYKMNTKNNKSYLFGNRLTSNIALFYVQKVKKLGVMPYMGIYTEYSGQDARAGKVLTDTGGHWIAQTTGLELYYQRFSIGANYQIPLNQRLAKGHIIAQNRGVLHLSFML